MNGLIASIGIVRRVASVLSAVVVPSGAGARAPEDDDAGTAKAICRASGGGAIDTGARGGGVSNGAAGDGVRGRGTPGSSGKPSERRSSLVTRCGSAGGMVVACDGAIGNGGGGNGGWTDAGGGDGAGVGGGSIVGGLAVSCG